jgi:hypothetical protein
MTNDSSFPQLVVDLAKDLADVLVTGEVSGRVGSLTPVQATQIADEITAIEYLAEILGGEQTVKDVKDIATDIAKETLHIADDDFKFFPTNNSGGQGGGRSR